MRFVGFFDKQNTSQAVDIRVFFLIWRPLSTQSIVHFFGAALHWKECYRNLFYLSNLFVLTAETEFVIMTTFHPSLLRKVVFVWVSSFSPIFQLCYWDGCGDSSIHIHDYWHWHLHKQGTLNWNMQMVLCCWVKSQVRCRFFSIIRTIA